MKGLRQYWAKRRIRQPLILQRKGTDVIGRALGDLGESLAASYLISRGCKLLYQNFRAPMGGEIDLVARDGSVLCFIEVKTRRVGGRGRPLDAVDQKKRALMRRGGRAWLKLLNRADVSWRHDVVEVLVGEGEPPRFQLIRDVKTSPSDEFGESSGVGEVR